MNRHGAQGILDSASKAMLENEFGTSRDEDVVQQILEKGEIQEATVRLPFLFFFSTSRLNHANVGLGE